MGNALVVQCLGLYAFIAKGAGLIPGQGTKILQVTHGAGKKKVSPKCTEMNVNLSHLQTAITQHWFL